MKSEFEIAITQLSSDRNVPPEVIIEAIEAALVSAYKRNYGGNQNIHVTVDRRTGQPHVYLSKTVVPTVEDEDTQITLADALKIDPNAVPGGSVEIEIVKSSFDRIAAQTAKQVIMQRIREAERDSVYLEFADRVGELANGIVRNVDARTQNVTVSLGKAEAVLPRSEQIPGEYYRFNQRLRVYLAEVERTGHGPQIIGSRTHKGLLRRLLELEVPEIYNGTVEIKAIAREAGSRSKVAVAALQPGVDPVGSCVGMRGVRIQNIVNELNGEKIDVVPWSEDMEEFIAHALSPAKVVGVHLNAETTTAKVVVPDNALSLAIGKEGQNARLAAKLTGWRIDIRSETEAAEEARLMEAEAQAAAIRAQEAEEARRQAAELLAEAEALLGADDEEEETALEPEVALAEAETEDEVAQPELVEEPTAELEPEVVAEAPEEAVAAPEVPAEEEVTPAAEAPALVTEAAEEEEEDPWQQYYTDDVEEEGTEEESAEDKKKAGRRKNRQRILEYDERLGEVVARKRRKRTGNKWRWGDEDF